MANSATIADDILMSLLSMDGVNEVELLMNGVDNLSDRDKKKFVEEIKDNNDLLTDDEAREKYGGE